MNVEEVIKIKVFHSPSHRTAIHLLLVGNRIMELIGQALKPYNVSVQQFNVLRILRGQKGVPSNLNTLNDRMISRMSNTTRLVDKLLDRGFVSRSVCATNRRKVEIFLTTAGAEILSQMDKDVKAVEEEMMRNLSPQELDQLNTLLNQIQ